jgi:hypothetical protein
MEQIIAVKREDHDDKYVVFKREAFLQMMGKLALPPWRDTRTGQLIGTDINCAVIAEDIKSEVDRHEVHDAVVIRRQDYFASPALASYAASIAIAAKLTEDTERKAELLVVADYFQRMSELAAEEGWKTPDV